MTHELEKSTTTVAREHLLTTMVNAHVDRIESHRVTLKPAQRSGAHVHPGGVIGYIVDGEIAFALEGQRRGVLRPGDVFHEPPGVTITHFDNASTSAGATFVAFYPLTGDQPLIVMNAQE